MPDAQIGERHSQTPNPRLDGQEAWPLHSKSWGDVTTNNAARRVPHWRTKKCTWQSKLWADFTECQQSPDRKLPEIL